MKTVINAVFDTVMSHRKSGFYLATLRKEVVKRVGVVSNETITRALRQLRDEGAVNYSYDSAKGIYKLGF